MQEMQNALSGGLCRSGHHVTDSCVYHEFVGTSMDGSVPKFASGRDAVLSSTVSTCASREYDFGWAVVGVRDRRVVHVRQEVDQTQPRTLMCLNLAAPGPLGQRLRAQLGGDERGNQPAPETSYPHIVIKLPGPP